MWLLALHRLMTFEFAMEFGSIVMGAIGSYYAMRHAVYFFRRGGSLAKAYAVNLLGEFAAVFGVLAFGTLDLFDALPEVGIYIRAPIRIFVFGFALIGTIYLSRVVRQIEEGEAK